MAKYRFPVLLWQDFTKNWTGALIEQYDDPAATGKSEREVLTQLKEYLSKLLKSNTWREPDFEKPVLKWFKVKVFPEYRVNEKRYPVDEKITLRVPCVLGKEEDGMMVCSAPSLGLQFYYYDEDGLEELVKHNVLEFLNGKRPDYISAFFRQGDFKIKDILINEPKEEDLFSANNNTQTLQIAASEMTISYIKRKFPPCIEREKEIETVFKSLEKDRSNVIISGGAGVGKKTLISAVITKSQRQNRDRKYWLSSAARIIAGMKYLGEWELRLEAMIDELQNTDGVLYLEKLVDLLKVGSNDPSNSIASFLMSFLQYKEVQIVTQATPAEINACRRLLPGFADLFKIITLDEMEEARSMSVLSKSAEMKSKSWQIQYDEESVQLSYSLFKRFVPYKAQPGASLTFLNRVFDRQRQKGQKIIDQNLIYNEFTKETGLPEIFLKDSLVMDPKEITKNLEKQVIGQPDACKKVTDIVTSFKAGMNDTERCLATLLFLGPTGVGKTEMAKALGRTFFGETEGANRVIRLDMSEFSGYDATDRLFGEVKSAGSLIDKIRQQPFSIVLFDEIEKASPEVFDVLMGLLDEGRLTDPFGRSTWFRSSVIIMTSNLGASLNSSISFDNRASDNYEKALSQFFRTEFINRIDHIVKFNSLTADNISKICEKELESLSKREGFLKHKIKLSWDKSVPAYLASKGYDEKLGARPLQRKIEELFTSKITYEMVKNGIKKIKSIHCHLEDEIFVKVNLK